MNKFYSILLVTIGAALIFLGFDSIPSLAPVFGRFFSHSPSSAAIWLLLAGIVVTATGLFRAWRDRSRFD
jgi:hypothetical protein